MDGFRRYVGLAAALGALALPAAVQAETFTTPSGSAPVTINDRGNGSPTVGTGTPYPSTLKVEGGNGDITDIDVNVTISHTFPDDIDLALVSPGGDAEVLMSDVCLGDALANDTFIFDQDAANDLPDDSQPPPCINGGRFQPTDADFQESADSWPGSGAPGSISTANLNSFDGENPNGNWRLFVVDDLEGHSGSIASWSLTITTQESRIVVPAGPETSGVASAYPSWAVYGFRPGLVAADIDLQILGFHHLYPDDVDMLLQAPSGEAAMIMSDACGTSSIRSGFSWLFNDEAAAQLHDTDLSLCQSTVYRPTNHPVTDEDMPAPAPAGPYPSSLSALEGLGTGFWNLYVADDSNSDTGYIDDWNLVITTRPAAATSFESNVPVSEGETATLTVTRTDPGFPLGPATLSVALQPDDADASDFGTAPSELVFARGEATKTIQIPITDDTVAEGAEQFRVVLSNPINDATLGDSGAIVKILGSDRTDDVQPGPPPEPPANTFDFGDVDRKANGSGQVEVTVPGPGTLTADDAGASAKLSKGSKNLLKLTSVEVGAAGTAVVPLKPARKAKRKLKRGKKVNVVAAVTYTPTGGSPNTEEISVKLKRKG